MWTLFKEAFKSYPGLYRRINKLLFFSSRYLPARPTRSADFLGMFHFLQASHYASPQQHENYQYEQTLKLIDFVGKNVAWYAKRFAEYEVSARQFVNLQDIKKFPVVTKEDIRDNLSLFLPRNTDRKALHYVTTGGSTGIPFGFYQTKTIQDIEDAFFSYHWGWHDCRLGDLTVVLRGGYVGNESNLFHFSRRGNCWHFSSYYLIDRYLPRYFEKLCQVKPVYIQAYPSAIVLLAQWMLSHGKKIDFGLKAIMCGSENLYPKQISCISDAFGVPVHCWYGQAEKVCLAPWSRHSQFYHVLPQYGLTEVVDNDFCEVCQEGQTGEIVASGFFNYVTPFLRYRTRDLAAYTERTSIDNLPYRKWSRLDGRLQELFVTGQGRLISMTAINMHDDVFDHVRQFQFYQEKPGELLLSIVPKPEYTQADEQAIVQKIGDKISQDAKLFIKTVEQIPRTKNGKLRFLIQKLDTDRWQ